MFKRIPGNVRRDSGECSKRFWGMYTNSGECSTGFRGIFKKISANLNLDLFCEMLLIFYQILQLNCEKAKEYFPRY